jgi:hypothetical protein
MYREQEHKINKYNMRYSDRVLFSDSTVLESNNLEGIFAEKCVFNLC